MLDGLGLRVGVVESVATDSSGIREAFVFAVRLALDRVRELMRTGDFATAQPEIDTPQELLEALKRSEDGSLDYAELSGLVHTPLAEVQPDSVLAASLLEAMEAPGARRGRTSRFSNEPATPDEGVASGMVWPPVDGRLVLHELARARVALQCMDNGDWAGIAAGKWRLHSGVDAVFSEIEAGRAALVQSARIQAQARDSPGACCIALAADGHGQFRLWWIERIGVAEAC
jgi:hypothetical protein